jgi:hypothetical protein
MCNSSGLKKALSLKSTPPGNDFLSQDDLGIEEKTYPLELYFCQNCHHIQLGHVVDPKILYQKNYTYVSATSKQFVDHLENYSKEMIDMFHLKPDSLVVDIGSNDGTCLSFFKSKNMKVLGVDPAISIAKKATKNGIQTIANFFNYDLASKILTEFGPAKFITSHNACAHIDNLLDVVKGVELLLDEDGVFVLEVGYLVDVYENTWFDTIYHEHLDFHTVGPFKKLFEQVNMEVINVQRISPQGGSIRVMAQKKNGKFKKKSSVEELIQLEFDLSLDKIETFYKFESQINLVRDKLHALIGKIKADGKTIAGFGAPTKATTLMGHFNLDESVLDFIVDDNPLKQGLYTPITHIPVLSAEAIYQKKPDYVLILAWNFSSPIMKIHRRYAKEIGQFILPMPTPQIVR